jgi:choline-glycine betaine transporter
MAIAAALPFAVVLIELTVGFMAALHQERVAGASWRTVTLSELH